MKHRSSSSWFDIGQSELTTQLVALPPQNYDELPFGAIVLSADGRVVHCNAAQATFAQQLPDDLIGRKFAEELDAYSQLSESSRLSERLAAGQRIDSTLLATLRFFHGWRHAKIRIVREAGTASCTYIFISPIRGSSAIESIPPHLAAANSPTGATAQASTA